LRWSTARAGLTSPTAFAAFLRHAPPLS
jgi:hypothetical protein